MNPTAPPGPEEARASLDQIAEARRAAAAAGRRPAWFDAIFATVTGLGVGLVTLRETPFWLAGVGVMAVGFVVLAVTEQRVRRRRGRILDERSIRAQPLRFLIPYAVVFVLILVRPTADWQPWYAIGTAIIVAIAGFAYLRWDEGYQTRRLAAGDYDRYDLI